MIEAETPNRVIKEFIETDAVVGWEYHALARDLYNAEEILRFYFFQPRRPDDYAMPQSVIGFAKENVNTLAHYKLLPNEVGLRFQITFNTVHLNRPVWSIYETLLHEMTHLYVENNPHISTPAKGHGAYFTAVCEEMGLHPRLGTGIHFKGADGQFARLMARWRVPKPESAHREVPKDRPRENWWDCGPRPRGTSTLLLYTCDDCARTPPCKIRSGKDDLELACKRCGGTFVPRR